MAICERQSETVSKPARPYIFVHHSRSLHSFHRKLRRCISIIKLLLFYLHVCVCALSAHTNAEIIRRLTKKFGVFCYICIRSLTYSIKYIMCTTQLEMQTRTCVVIACRWMCVCACSINFKKIGSSNFRNCRLISLLIIFRASLWLNVATKFIVVEFPPFHLSVWALLPKQFSL